MSEYLIRLRASSEFCRMNQYFDFIFIQEYHLYKYIDKMAEICLRPFKKLLKVLS